MTHPEFENTYLTKRKAQKLPLDETFNNKYTHNKEKNSEIAVKQYVIRNYDKKGYETVYSSTGGDLPEYLLPLILPKHSIKRKKSYFLKWPLKENYQEDATLVKMVIGDGNDKFGRNKAKLVILIIPNTLYEANHGLLYYASPIWRNKLSLDDDDPLTIDDFEKVSITSPKMLIKKLNINKSLVENILNNLFLFKHVLIKNDINAEKQINKTLAFVDYCLPKFFRNKISFKSSCNKKNYLFANCCVLENEGLPKELQNDQNIINANKILNGNKGGNNDQMLYIVNLLLNAASVSEKEKIGENLLDQRWVITEKLISQGLYKKLLDRFKIKNRNGNGFSHLLTQLKNNIT